MFRHWTRQEVLDDVEERFLFKPTLTAQRALPNSEDAPVPTENLICDAAAVAHAVSSSRLHGQPPPGVTRIGHDEMAVLRNKLRRESRQPIFVMKSAEN